MACKGKLSRGEACGENTRKTAGERLREKAIELFYKRGIRAVGVDEIVCETGVTKPTLYRSFESKDALVAACLRSHGDESRARLDAITIRAGAEPLAQLRAVIDEFAREIATPGFRGCPMTNAAVEFPEDDHPAREVSEECKAELRERLVKLCRQLPTDDADGLADGLLLLIEGATSIRHTSGSQGPACALLRTADTLLAAHLDEASGRKLVLDEVGR